MICRIQGILESIGEGKVIIDNDGPFTYEVLVNAFTQSRLMPRVGEVVVLQTVYFLEGTSQGTSFVPRLAGFLSENDKAFFELFTTVKGIGAKKAMRSIALDVSIIAAAITDRDTKLLQSLPEIGKRMAETIIVTLHGKVDRFVSAATYPATHDGSGDEESGVEGKSPGRSIARETLEVLLQLGENRTSAIQWIDQALAKTPDIDNSQDLLSEVFHIKSGQR